MPSPNTIQYTVAKAGVGGDDGGPAHRTRGRQCRRLTAFCPGPGAQPDRQECREPSSQPFQYGLCRKWDKRRASGSGLNTALWMDPVEVGEIVLEGVRRAGSTSSRTAEFGPGIRGTMRRADGGQVLDKPRNAEFEAALPFLLHNPIFHRESASLKEAQMNVALGRRHRQYRLHDPGRSALPRGRCRHRHCRTAYGEALVFGQGEGRGGRRRRHGCARQRSTWPRCSHQLRAVRAGLVGKHHRRCEAIGRRALHHGRRCGLGLGSHQARC